LHCFTEWLACRKAWFKAQKCKWCNKPERTSTSLCLEKNQAAKKQLERVEAWNYWNVAQRLNNSNESFYRWLGPTRGG
jgi:recombinational DNA repair protein RecR